MTIAFSCTIECNCCFDSRNLQGVTDAAKAEEIAVQRWGWWLFTPLDDGPRRHYCSHACLREDFANRHPGRAIHEKGRVSGTV